MLAQALGIRHAVSILLMLMPWSTPANPADLRLTVTYAGEERVDASHRIWVFFWDRPDIENATPILFRSISENGTEIQISNLRSTPIYITCIFDVDGGYDPSRAMGPPPPWSPRGAHRGDPPASELAPVELREGEIVSIEIRFGGPDEDDGPNR
jgi:hypothetical protein